MLSGSAVLRVSLLLIVAGALAAFVQHVWPYRGTEPAEAPQASVTAPAKPARRVETRPAPVPSQAAPQQAAPSQAAPPAAQPEAPPAPAPAPRPMAGLDPAPQLPAPASPPAPGSPLAPEAPPALPVPAPVEEPQAADPAPEEAAPRAVNLVDLNTGSLAELNHLRGGGAIGRAIIQKRPYASVDQLLSKRVLSRATYDRIKDQVTVQ
ncbi:hypothetical protein J2X36_003402 [Methylobacterium sp. BE186]|uniref:ComEA family DNA-binding protein n=1 Tax=Methylobacterium sp. BE186 TaxID=2817715 RepID=UPI002855CB6F|nr:helix-hairpin-helix domain-containing protein [Methylobacterium sp. BE186]MDR7038632.1 hypothetical protein [Methylobacterium sp. BE186]